jgi:hypothetical protein
MFVLTANGSYVQVSGVASSEMLSSAYLAQSNPYSLSAAAVGPKSGEAAVPSTDGAEAGTGGGSTAPPLRALLKDLSARLIPRYMIFYGDDRHTCNIAAKTRPPPHRGTAAAAGTGVGACASPGISPRAIRSYYYLQPNSTITEARYPLLFKTGSAQGGALRTYYDYIFIHPLLSQSKPTIALDLYRQIFLSSATQFPKALAEKLALPSAGAAAACSSLSSATTADQSMLLALCKSILEGYKSCNMSLLLSLYCKQPTKTVPTVQPASAKRRGGRGKRGGRHVRQRVLFQHYLAGESTQLKEISCVSADAQNPLVWDGSTGSAADYDGYVSAVDKAVSVGHDGPDKMGVFLSNPAVPAFDFYALLDSITASEGSLMGTSVLHARDSVVFDSSVVAPPPFSKRKRKRHAPDSGARGEAAGSNVTPRSAVPSLVPLTTIGERLYSRVSRCCRRDRRCSAAGYVTQDEDEDCLDDSVTASDELETALRRTDGACGESCVDRHIAEYFASASYRQLLAPLSCRLPIPVVTPMPMVASGDVLGESMVHKRSRSLPAASSTQDVALNVAQRSVSTGSTIVGLPKASILQAEADTGYNFKMECTHVAAAAVSVVWSRCLETIPCVNYKRSYHVNNCLCVVGDAGIFY